ncbi:MAG: hypothetical protein GVY13_04135 [Alphaproteobacteria bacterium]|nr:hypothetical protein [Alphaproteobacteria bacterium]
MPVPKKFLLAVLAGLVALAGLITAAQTGEGSPYVLGLAAFVAGVLFVMAMVKAHFDGKPDARLVTILPKSPEGARRLLVILTLAFLAGLFVAAGSSAYETLGLLLSGVALILGFLTLKRLYDLIDARRH